MIEVQPAKPTELEDVLDVLDQAAAWLQTIGITEQWPASFGTDPAWIDRFRRWISAGYVHIARDAEGRRVGCFRLMPSDDHIWPNEPGTALYLHSLAVVRWVAGQGVAQTMLDGAVRYAAAQGVDELRLDCWAGNERLKRYYLEAGFESRGESEVPIESGEFGASRTYRVAKFAKRAR